MSRTFTFTIPTAQADFGDDLWIEIDEFDGQLKAIAKNDHIGYFDVNGGGLTVHRLSLRRLGELMIEMADVWEGIPT